MAIQCTNRRRNLNSGDAGYLALAAGAIEVNGVLAQAREGVVIKKETAISIKAVLDSELVLVVTA